MFLDLIRLYSRQRDSNKTPLEDFNTECFANILKLYPDIKIDFIEKFLKLPIDEYEVSTQLRKSLIDTQDCIVDLVFLGKNNSCFIECKVESNEGWEQLLRYSMVLDNYYPNEKKYLFYLTKYSDVKNLDGFFTTYNFKHFRWYEIAKFLKQFSTVNPLINEYLKFLENYNMAQDNTLKSENLVTMENMRKTIEILEFHIENSREYFKNLFGSANPNLNFNWGQIKEANRVSHYNGYIINTIDNGYSEILYSIQLDTLMLNTQISLPKESKHIEVFNNLNFDHSKFSLTKDDYGSTISIQTDLGSFLNDENADKNIRDWFIKSFDLMKDLMVNNPQLDWNIK